jgi:hypothetical protein
VIQLCALGLTLSLSSSALPADLQYDQIRPFRVNIPEKEIVALRRRIAATRWPTRELVKDRAQGVQLATLTALARYWMADYDWRKAEARLNAYPQFVTKIDGVDIHFIHVKSRHANGLPLIITHGWPGSVFELLEIIDPLTNPTAHGGGAMALGVRPGAVRSRRVGRNASTREGARRIHDLPRRDLGCAT